MIILNNVWLERFKPCHLEMFEPGYRERKLMGNCPNVQDTLFRAYSIRDDSHIFIIGLLLASGGGWRVTLLISDTLRRNPFALHRFAKRFVERMADTLTATVDPDDVACMKWLKSLGFARIGDEGDLELWCRVAS